MPLLEVEDIHVFYGNIEAIRGVSIHVEPGEMVAILGSNGAGKTTTLRTISGLERARSGSVRFDGKDVSRTPAHQIVERGLCQVPEGRRIFSTLTVLENLTLGGYVYRRRPQEVKTRREKVLETFPILAERTGQLAGTLSGGEQQMLAIGRALMAEPRLLILDEPSLGLSPILVDEVFSLVKRLNAEGLSILLVEQNVGQALEIAHRAYVLENGAMTFHGTPAELLGKSELKRAYLGI